VTPYVLAGLQLVNPIRGTVYCGGMPTVAPMPPFVPLAADTMRLAVSPHPGAPLYLFDGGSRCIMIRIGPVG
jgi:hypothetical protein